MDEYAVVVVELVVPGLFSATVMFLSRTFEIMKYKKHVMIHNPYLSHSV